LSAGYAVITMSLEPLQLFTVGVNGCSIHLAISHSDSKESATSDYSTKSHFRLYRRFWMSPHFGEDSGCWRISFNRRTRCYISVLWLFSFHWHILSVLLSLGSVNSAVVSFFNCCWFLLLLVFFSKGIYSLIWHCILLPPGLSTCQRIKVNFFSLAEVCFCLNGY